MAEPIAATASSTTIPKRFVLVALCFVATFICYIDRTNISVAIIPMAEQYGWSGTTRGLVLSSFFIGYIVAMIPSGWLANRFGGRVFLGVALLAWSLFTVLTPFAAGISLGALLATRIAMGVFEAATFPSAYNLFGRWMLPTERTRAVALNASGLSIGTVFSLSVCGTLIASFGWQSVFWLFGLAGAAYALVWFRHVHASPAEHPHITPQERALLAPLAQGGDARREPIPWRRLFASSAVWAFVYNHFCANWIMYLMLTWLPSYFRDVQHLSITSSGLFAVLPWLCMVGFGNAAAAWADRLIANGADVTRVRKIAQITALLATAGCFIAASEASTAGAALLALCGALGFNGVMWAGYGANALEIAPRHADVLFSISNTAATLPGIVGVYLTGWLLDATGGYTATFVTAAVVSLSGAIVWLIWGTGRRVID